MQDTEPLRSTVVLILGFTITLALPGCFSGSSSSSDTEPVTEQLDTATAADLEGHSNYGGEQGSATLSSPSEAVRAADLVYLGERVRHVHTNFMDQLAAENAGDDIPGDCGSGTVDYSPGDPSDTIATWVYEFDGFCMNEPRGAPTMGAIVIDGYAVMTLDSSDDVDRQHWTFDDLTYGFANGEYEVMLNGEEHAAGAFGIGEHTAFAVDIEHGGETYRYLSDEGSDIDERRSIKAYLPDLGYITGTESDSAVMPFNDSRLFRDFICATGIGLPQAATGSVSLGGGGDLTLELDADVVSTCGDYQLSGTLSDGTDLPAQDQRLGESFFTIVEHTATFDATGGDPTPQPQTVEHGDTVIQPANPSRDGFDFTGWEYVFTTFPGVGDIRYQWDFSANTLTQDRTLYAVWWDPADAETPEGLQVARDGEVGTHFKLRLPSSGLTETRHTGFTASLLNGDDEVIRAGVDGENVSIGRSSPTGAPEGAIYTEADANFMQKNAVSIEEIDTTAGFTIRTAREELEVGDKFNLTLSVSGESASQTILIEMVESRDDEEVLP